MTGPATWLPETALFDGRLTELVDARLERWRSKWFGRTGRLAIRLKAGARRQPAVAGWTSTCGGITACINTEQRHRLAGAILGIKRIPRSPTPLDTRLLDGMATDAVRDLMEALATPFGVTPEITPLPTKAPPVEASLKPLQFSVAGAYGLIMDLVVTAGAASAARKAMTKPLRPLLPLSSRNLAQSALRVTVAARIGSSQISRADLQSLGVNDVLVLDSKLTDAPRLTFNGHMLDDSRLSLVRTDSALVISCNEDRTNS